MYIKHLKITMIRNKYINLSCEIIMFHHVFMLALAQLFSMRISML